MTDDTATPGKPFAFSIFNRDALLKSNQTPFNVDKVTIDPSSSFLRDDFTFTAAKASTDDDEYRPKTRGQKKRGKKNKDIGDPKMTIKEIIENDKAGVPTQSERKVQEERIKVLRESRRKKKAGQAALPEETKETRSQPAQKEKDPKPQEVDEGFAPTTLVFKDGKVVLEQNLSLLPTVPEKVHELAARPKTLNSMSFRQKVNSKKWTPEEDKKFFKLLKMFGSDFSMIAKVFGNRTRDEIKNKFLREERQNPGKIDEMLKRNKKYNLHHLMDPLSKPKPLTSGETPVAKGGELVLHGQSNHDDEDEFNKRPGLAHNISSASIDSMDYKLIGNIERLLHEALPSASRSTSQISPTRFLTAPGLEKGLSTQSNDLTTIPLVSHTTAAEKQEKEKSNGTWNQLQRIEEAPTRDTTNKEARVSHESNNGVISSQSSDPKQPKNLFFHS